MLRLWLPLTADCRPCLTYQLRGLAGYLSRPGPPRSAYLIPQGRLSSPATRRTAHSVEARAMLHCCIDQVTNIFAIAFHQSVQAGRLQTPARRVFLLFKFVYIHVVRLAGGCARHIKIKRSIVCGLLEI